MKIRDPSTGAIVETVRTTVPDLAIATGTLQPSAHVEAGATLLARYRRVQAFKGEAPLVWTVTGETGELRLTATGGPGLNAMSHGEPVAIEVYDFATETVEDVGWKWDEARSDLPVNARNIGALYEAFAQGDESRYPTFDHAVKRHRQLETMLAKFEPK